MQRQSIVVSSDAATEPITATQAKAWLKVDSSDDDTLITDLIKAARLAAERYVERAFITQTIVMTLDRFPLRKGSRDTGYEHGFDGVIQAPITSVRNGSDEIVLPRPPLQSVTSVVTYDENNSDSTFSASKYLVDTAGGRVVLNRSQTWPSDLRDKAAVVITYISGYGDNATDIPEDIRTAIKMLVKQWYDNGRMVGEMPANVESILQRHKVYENRINE